MTNMYFQDRPYSSWQDRSRVTYWAVNYTSFGVSYSRAITDNISVGSVANSDVAYCSVSSGKYLVAPSGGIFYAMASTTASSYSQWYIQLSNNDKTLKFDCSKNPEFGYTSVYNSNLKFYISVWY